MAKEIARRIDIAARTVTIDVQDIFGCVTHHTVPLFGDACPMCQMALAGGTPDLNATAAAVLAGVSTIENAILAKLQASGIDVPLVSQPQPSPAQPIPPSVPTASA